tara:strand:- start:8012 stop:8431 length:420 start_codon:yes stop_codon:yes gene_type:complete
MGTRTNRFIHRATNSTSIASVGTSYDAAKKHEIDLGSYPKGSPFVGRINGLIIQCSAMSSGPAPQQIHYLMSTDAAGNKPIFGADTGEISAGVTTTGVGGTSYRIDMDFISEVNSTVYIFYKTDAGTLTIDKTIVMWHE